jgi:hypothetical protein
MSYFDNGKTRRVRNDEDLKKMNTEHRASDHALAWLNGKDEESEEQVRGFAHWNRGVMEC